MHSQNFFNGTYYSSSNSATTSVESTTTDCIHPLVNLYDFQMACIEIGAQLFCLGQFSLWGKTTLKGGGVNKPFRCLPPWSTFFYAHKLAEKQIF